MPMTQSEKKPDPAFPPEAEKTEEKDPDKLPEIFSIDFMFDPKKLSVDADWDTDELDEFEIHDLLMESVSPRSGGAEIIVDGIMKIAKIRKTGSLPTMTLTWTAGKLEVTDLTDFKSKRQARGFARHLTNNIKPVAQGLQVQHQLKRQAEERLRSEEEEGPEKDT